MKTIALVKCTSHISCLAILVAIAATASAGAALNATDARIKAAAARVEYAPKGRPAPIGVDPDAGMPAAAISVAKPFASAATPLPAGQAARVTTNYQVDDSFFANPERGFYRQQHACEQDGFADNPTGPVTSTTLNSYYANGFRLVMCFFKLPTEADEIPNELAMFKRQARAVKAAGLKMIVRFHYGRTPNDAGFDRVMAHLDRLAPVLHQHSNVIAVVQSGFVGAYGEGAASTHFGTNEQYTPTNVIQRRAIIQRVVDIMPKTRMVQVRTFRMKRDITQTDAHPTISSMQSANPPLIARVGHHNDCFLSAEDGDTTEKGTWLKNGYTNFAGIVENIPQQKKWVHDDTEFVAMGGETCTNPPSVGCGGAKASMNYLNYSFLNQDWNTDVVASWNTPGCRSRINRRLGYRLSLSSVTFPTSVTRTVATPLSIVVRNIGWARPMNRRPVQLILRNISTGALHRISTGMRVRLIAGGGSLNFTNHAFKVPSSVPAGKYAMLLNLPDPDPALANDFRYSVRLASKLSSGAAAFEPLTGFNRLGRTVKVAKRPFWP
jgi:hypothetical protein